MQQHFKKVVGETRLTGKYLPNSFGRDYENPLFNSSNLEEFINWKLSELDTMASIASANGNRVRLLDWGLDSHLREKKKYASVLLIPPLETYTNSILELMCSTLLGTCRNESLKMRHFKKFIKLTNRHYT